jgi:hypothetical protein
MPKAKKRRRNSKPYFSRAAFSPAINPILTPQDVREIRRLYRMADEEARRSGRSKVRHGLRKDLARRFKVSPWTISHIRRGDRWSTLK